MSSTNASPATPSPYGSAGAARVYAQRTVTSSARTFRLMPSRVSVAEPGTSTTTCSIWSPVTQPAHLDGVAAVPEVDGTDPSTPTAQTATAATVTAGPAGGTT